MEQARVVVVGAGPAGLVAGLSLEQQGIASIILEREPGIVEDPRGVYLAADAVRILYALGLGPDMPKIGHGILDVHKDSLQQTVPTGILQIQPELGCEVESLRQDGDGAIIEYKDSNGSKNTLQTEWLIGADGKRGVVRKTFLEKVADIRQVHSSYRYEGTWIAANLKLSLPTPETHPDFPAWKLGMSPQEVYDLFWPKGWHFCSPPGKPTATGRFGPHEQRYWRIAMGASHSNDNQDGRQQWPFTFTHKIVNRWYHRKTVLIGDAAHVFPPFGGQGIASGIRDAHQLAWRIALIENASSSNATQLSSDAILEAWSKERTQSVADAAYLTKMNGTLCNNASPMLFTVIHFIQWVVKLLFPSAEDYDPQALGERNGMRNLAGGFFLSKHGGGLRIPQVFVDTIMKGTVKSDEFFVSAPSPMQILVLVRGDGKPQSGRHAIRTLLDKHQVPHGVISPDATSTLSLAPCSPESVGSFAERSVRKASLTPLRRLNKRQARPGYSVDVFDTRLGKSTQYVILRPDFYIFATARDERELGVCLQGLKGMLEVS
ncbi:related to monooxygenase [Ramularia collo-cygni]|uniref:Related to monooxygenase n=1 Tax=Ramularia collo-cygni TaxID=112498 RepID=A0A2D3VHL6_9PEZI|nr:related to monooxygenase [Ramularia collo-cygni]CZT20253.1 related to monooxygenase [Ramularia collo-cygni]